MTRNLSYPSEKSDDEHAIFDARSHPEIRPPLEVSTPLAVNPAILGSLHDWEIFVREASSARVPIEPSEIESRKALISSASKRVLFEVELNWDSKWSQVELQAAKSPHENSTSSTAIFA